MFLLEPIRRAWSSADKPFASIAYSQLSTFPVNRYIYTLQPHIVHEINDFLICQPMNMLTSVTIVIIEVARGSAIQKYKRIFSISWGIPKSWPPQLGREDNLGKLQIIERIRINCINKRLSSREDSRLLMLNECASVALTLISMMPLMLFDRYYPCPEKGDIQKYGAYVGVACNATTTYSSSQHTG